MIHRPFLRRAVPLIAFALLVAAPAHAGVRAALQPESLLVAPGDTFTVQLRVPEAGSPFNGFEATVSFDPAVLTFLPLSPISLQEGASMKSACVNTFHRFEAAGDSLTIVDVLLCAGVTLSGPATLYQLRFIATGPPQVTHVRLRSVRFYDDGLYVNPVVPSDAVIGIGAWLDAGPPRPVPRVPRVRALPNPARGPTTLEIDSPEAGEQRVVVVDALGRIVRHLDRARADAGMRRLVWDGRDDRGRLTPPGLYRTLVRTGAREVGVALVRLR